MDEVLNPASLDLEIPPVALVLITAAACYRRGKVLNSSL